MKPSIISLVFLSASFSAGAQDRRYPDLDGYITRVASASDFDVNGVRIFCNEKTLSEEPVANTEPRAAKEIAGTQGCPSPMPYIGEPMTIYGAMKKKEHTLMATLIVASPIRPGEISGSAVIDALPGGNSFGTHSDELLVRADGYAIRINAQTAMKWSGGLRGAVDVKAGDWIEYRGSPAKDGNYFAQKARIFPVVVSKGESKLRAKSDFDPSAVSDDAKQNLLRASIIGFDPKRFPPYKDAAMQARVERIGERLIPRWNHEMPDSNPAKIHFRFQVVDAKWFHDAWTLPSGVILISHQVVERLENDDQLATVLADNIACALERQDYRVKQATQAATGAMFGADVVDVFVPFAGPAIQAATIGGAAEVVKHQRDQSGRVSLGLLKDAGYDIRQAPLAWWRLETLKDRSVTAPGMPDRAAYLYKVLGENWGGGAELLATKP
jgi:hypothetical protein